MKIILIFLARVEGKTFCNFVTLKNKTQKAPEVEDMALQPGDEKEQILAALKKARGNKTVAAKLLQIDRKTLYNKMHLYGIDLT